MDIRFKGPKLSVRLMTYNHVDFIDKAMAGILMQKTNFPVEIVIGDDFSTDGTLDKIKKFSSTEKIRIKILDRKKGDDYWKKRQELGRLYNFTNILENCSGEYIALLDGDDYWLDPLKLQKQVDFLENNPDYVLTHHDAGIVDEQEIVIKEGKLPEKNKRDFSSIELQQGPFLLTLTLCFRNVEILKNIPDEMMTVSNGDKFLISLLGAYGKGRFIPEIKPGLYRSHSGSVWSKIDPVKKYLTLFNTNRQLASYYRKIEIPSLEEYFIESSKRSYCSMLARQVYNRSFKEFFKSAHYYIQISPDPLFSKCCTVVMAGYRGMGSFVKKSFKSKF